ncbi:hypothetical protein Tco_1367125, partial [Tanacetum coccineum]
QRHWTSPGMEATLQAAISSPSDRLKQALNVRKRLLNFILAAFHQSPEFVAILKVLHFTLVTWPLHRFQLSDMRNAKSEHVVFLFFSSVIFSWIPIIMYSHFILEKDVRFLIVVRQNT